MSTQLDEYHPMAGTPMPEGDPQQMRVVQYLERRRIGKRMNNPGERLAVLFILRRIEGHNICTAAFPTLPWQGGPACCAGYTRAGDAAGWASLDLATLPDCMLAGSEERRALHQELDAVFGPLDVLGEMPGAELERYESIRRKIIAGMSLR